MIWHVGFTRDHCFAFRYDPGADVWLLVNPGAFATITKIMRPRVFDRWIRLVARRAYILRLGSARSPSLGLGFWCVGVVKKLVGARSSALSPAGLKRDLERSGAIRVFVPRSP